MKDRSAINNSATKAARLLLLFCLIAIIACAGKVFALEVPDFRGYVNDYANMISPQSKLEIERALQSFDMTDSTQIAVLTIKSLEGDSLEDFSIRTVDKWGIGRKGKDNGVLLLVVKDDRKTRIEVGRGLEGVLTDLAAGRIIDNVMNPLFKANRFDDGFKAGIVAIVKTTRGEYTADKGLRRSGRGNHPPPFLAYIFFGILIISFLGRASKPLGMLAGAIMLPAAAFLGLSSPLSLLAILFLVPIGAFGGLLLPLIVGNMLLRGGGFYMGGGGFGGGGGGASGDW